MIHSLIDGYNSTCFAYGMTGSGKTHTMLGDIYGSSNHDVGICVLAVSWSSNIGRSYSELDW